MQAAIGAAAGVTSHRQTGPASIRQIPLDRNDRREPHNP
jgi:hypothetical protein